MLRWKTHIPCFTLCILGIFLLYPALSRVLANEAVRLAGMGGAFVGLYSTEGGIFGNPAGLINLQANNLSVALSAQNLDYESLPSGEDEQLNTSLSFRLSPSIYYSRVIGGIGIGLGYIDDLDNRSSIFRIENTEAEYIVDERKFVSDTDTVLEYDLFREKGPVFSLGYPLNPRLAIGIRLKYRHGIIKEGLIHRPLHLEAVHGEEVNRNDATKLLPAIIDNLEMEDAIERFREGKDGHEDVIADLSGSGFDFDLGMQARLSASGNVSAGFMLDVLDTRYWMLDAGQMEESGIQYPVSSIQYEPSRIRFGIGTMPKKWLAAALDLQKVLGDSGLNVNLGWEVCHRWQRWFSGGIMIRNGFAHESSSEAKDKLSIGIGLVLGGSHWDYTLVKPLDGSPIRKAAHMFSSTTRF